MSFELQYTSMYTAICTYSAGNAKYRMECVCVWCMDLWKKSEMSNDEGGGVWSGRQKEREA